MLHPSSRAGLRLAAIQAAAGAVAMNLIQPFIPVLAIRLGASNRELAGLSALPNLLAIPALLVGGWALRRPGANRMGTLVALLAARCLWLLAAAVPWLPPPWRVQALVLAWALAGAPQAAAGAALNALLADLFPGENLGPALAVRNAASTAAGMATGLAAGLVLDRLAYPAGYQGLFTAAVAVGLAEVALLGALVRAVEGRRPPAALSQTAAPAGDGGGVRAGGAPGGAGAAGNPGADPAAGAPASAVQAAWRALLGSRPYLRFTAASLVFHFVWMMAWPMFARLQVSELGATNTWVSLLNLANAATATVTYRWWSHLAGRWGQRRAMALAAFLLALLPGLNAAAPDLYWLVPVNLLGGVATSGVLLLVTQILVEVAPAHDRTLFLAANQALVAAVATVAPLAGGVLMDWLAVRGALVVATALRLTLGVACWWWLDRVEGRQV